MKITSPKMAKQAGVTRYFTGKPCARGHMSERMASTRACVECHKATQAKYREEKPEVVAAIEARRAAKHCDKRKAKNKAWAKAHPEKCRLWATAWAEANPERKHASNRAWRLANAEKVKTDLKAWRAANPEHVRTMGLIYRNQRRAALLKRTPAWADRKAIADIYQDAAEFRAAGIEVDVDHEIPLQGELVSGLHVHNNLRVCMSSFNRAKSNTFHI